VIISALTITRGDRPQFLQMNERMVEYQTVQPDYHVTVGFKPKDNNNDVAQRYIQGFGDCCLNLNSDLVIVFEDDDYYSPKYIETMVKLWENAGKPSCLGYDNTWYYHLGLKKYVNLQHPGRASMFNSIFTKDVMKCRFGDLSDPFLDIRLWKQLKGYTHSDKSPICIGIKHGVGMTAGAGHKKNFRYKYEDEQGLWLQRQTNNFYEAYYSNTPK
jgi:hypothetical protein